MVLENYCKHCGQRILPNEPYCISCGSKTKYDAKNYECVLEPPIHNIGFFNFNINFAPYIIRPNQNYKYEICSCGYINSVENEYCYMCGSKRSFTRLERLLKSKSKPKFSIGNILCECGAVNSKDSIFCEMCGRQLREDQNVTHDNYSNFNLKYTDSKFCFCGEENEKFALFCNNCGLPLNNYGKSSEISILCTCSAVNEITSDYCVECGENLNRENSLTVCICGEHNKTNLKHCQECERPLNPKRNIKTRIICSCGQILDWDTDYCHNCGKNIKKSIMLKKSINNKVKNIKSLFR